MPGAFRRPVEREADGPLGGNRAATARAWARANSSGTSRALWSRRARRLLAASKLSKQRASAAWQQVCARPRAPEISDGLPLMPVCLGQNEADMLAEASGQRALVHRRNNALTSG